MGAGRAQTLGLIAGWGRFPLDLARAARAHGHRVAAVAFHGLTDPELEGEADALAWLHLGQLEQLIRTLREAGAETVVLAGKVPKTHLFEDADVVRPDARALALLAGLADQRDDAILAAIADALEAEGIAVRPQAELVPELLAPEGRLGRVAPSPEHLADVRFAWPIARALGALDVGQTVVVRDRAVLAVEAIEGTDAAIRRGGSLGRSGVCVVKVSKPKQDPRFDLPAVGPETLAVLVEAKAALLAVEAGRTLVLDRDEVVRLADVHGICVLGVAEDALAAGAVP